MVLLDHRMAEGQPLHYYFPYDTTPFQTPAQELILPPSPINSAQSDSDNSLSSNNCTSSRTKCQEIRCCWISCGRLFASPDQLGNHITRLHATNGPSGLFYCGWEGCTRNNKGFNARYKMLVHVRTHTNEKPHGCSQCGKAFSRAENLKIHSRSHSGEKPYVCLVAGCGKAYSNSSDRFKHTRTHLVEKPYRCKVAGCEKRYTDPSSLRKHVKTFRHADDDRRDARWAATEENVQIDQRNEVTTRSDCECNCSYMCYDVNKGSSESRLYEFIDFKKNMCMSRINLLEPLPGPNNRYVSYDYHDSIGIDLPLDLRVNRTIIRN